eukprot:m.359109 g.359109  ORF g.359109 m.359109 type:complete len:441 (-) comp18416_c0_seq1:250-1572(-)
MKSPQLTLIVLALCLLLVSGKKLVPKQCKRRFKAIAAKAMNARRNDVRCGDWRGGKNVSWKRTCYLKADTATTAQFSCTRSGVKFASPFPQPTFYTVDSSGTMASSISLALQSNGNAVIYAYDPTNFDAKLAVCNNEACSAPQVSTVASKGNVGSHGDLAMGNSDRPFISFLDLDNGALALVVCNDEACSSPQLTLSVDSAGGNNEGQHSSIALTSAGNPVICYYDYTSFDLKLAVCGDAVCSPPQTSVINIDSSGVVGQYSSLALDNSDNPIMSYYDNTNNRLKLAVCNDPTCSNPQISVIDSTGDVGQHTSLALDSNQHPVISYLDVDNENLKLAVCNDQICSSPQITVVDSEGEVGYHNSLALDSSGNAVISYTDDTTGALKLALCNNAACSAPRTGVLKEKDCEFTSLALDSAGKINIAFNDYTNQELLLAVLERA